MSVAMTIKQAVTQWLTDSLTNVLCELWKQIVGTFATKTEVAAIEQTVDLQKVSQSTAAAIWNDYVFATTDNDDAQSNNSQEQSGEEQQEESGGGE